MPLTEQAQKIIEAFKHQIEQLPATERIAAIKQMTEYLSALNESTKEIVSMLHRTRRDTPPPEMDLSDFK